MPIRPELRHYYRGPEWQAIRRRILERAKLRCERCGKPHGAFCHVARDGTGRWRLLAPRDAWRDGSGRLAPPPKGPIYTIRSILTTAHLNHDPADNRHENLAVLCQHCHLAHDGRQHYWARLRREAERAGQQRLSVDIDRGAA